MTKVIFKNVDATSSGHLKYPAEIETWRTFPGAKLAVGWGLVVVAGDECGSCMHVFSERE